MSWAKTRLKFLSKVPITNGIGEPGSFDDPTWPRYVRTTDIAGPRELRDDVFASLPPEVARRAMLRRGDLVMTAAGATIGKSLLYDRDQPACYAGYLVRFRPRSDVDGRFVAYWMESQAYWEQIVTGKVVSTIENFSAGKYRNLQLSLPNHDEQRAIVDYLDRETARIDALIAAKQRMLVLLTERARELVADRLLGPPVPGAGAAAEQITARPGWRTTPFRWLFREIDERSTTGDETLLSVSQTRGVIPQAELGDRRQYAETLIGYKLCRAGDLVVNRMWVYYGALGSSHYEGIVSPDYAVFRPTDSVSSEFAAYVLRTAAYVAEMTRLVRGIGAAFQGAVRKPRLHPNELGLIAMPVPPHADQARILEQLDSDTRKLNTQMSLLHRSVALLYERRQALITAAVTGQLEVTVAA